MGEIEGEIAEVGQKIGEVKRRMREMGVFKRE